MKRYKLGIIGMGNMATAITVGIIDSLFLKNSDICFFEIEEEKSKRKSAILNINNCRSLHEIFQLSSYILLAFKPQNLKESYSDIKKYFNINENVLMSILAGIPINYFEKIIGKDAKIIRIMPNTPAYLKKGVSAISINKNVDETEKDFSVRMFECIGETVIIEEQYQNLITSLSGSSPAYFYLICKYMIDFGLANGLDESTARKLVVNTMIGSGEMMREANENLDSMIKKVASKGGTTEKALESFTKNNLKKIITDALDSVLIRANEMEKFVNQ